MSSRREQVFTVDLEAGVYKAGNEVGFYADMKEADQSTQDSQKFTANADGTISPLKAPGLVLGMEATSGI